MRVSRINDTKVNLIYNKKANNKWDMNLDIKNYATNSVLQAYPASFYINNFVSFKGNEELAGYDKEKEKISKLLITPIKEDRNDIPSGIVLYAEDSKVSSKFIDSVAKQTNANVVTLEPKSEFLDLEIYNSLEKIQDKYFNEGKRTILVIKNSDYYLPEISENERNWNYRPYANVTELCNYILDIASKRPEQSWTDDFGDFSAATTIILETENPNKLNPQILEKVSGVIALPVRTRENTEKLLKSELEKNRLLDKNILPDNEFNFLIQKLCPKKETGAFSDSKIAKMVKRANEEFSYDGQNFAKILYSIIDGTKRDISPKRITESNETVKWLAENNYIESIKIANVLENKINELLTIEKTDVTKPEKANELSDKEAENYTLITSISEFNSEELKDIMIGDTSLPDFWLDLENSGVDKNRIKQNDRLKNIWFNNTVKDEEKVKNFISITLDKLQNENELIKTARESYKDIIENDTTITDNQKEILVNQQESLLFFKVISNKLNTDDILKMELNVLDTLEQLENEKTSVKKNAINNIFNPVRNSGVLTSANAEDIENTEYIISLAKEALQSNNYGNKEKIDVALEKFSQAKTTGDNCLLDESWNEIVDLTQEYFETEVLDGITNRNIELLNSINEKVDNNDSKRIKDLTKDKTLSIEQREFIARHKDDKNFKILLNNQNIDIKPVIKDLVFFESSNRALLEENDINEESISLNQIMSDKFKQINNENKDIKIQTDRVLDKLGEIETSISDFSGNFNSYANDMLDIEANELQQLSMANDYLFAISNNTKDIKEYTQAITRTKLVELGKDKYYKDIVPEITKLLPSDEQINIKDFMQKVQELAKNEKDAKRKKTIIKAGVAVAGTLALGAGAYYFGPQIVAHLASKLPVAQAGLIANETIKATNVAKRIGNSQLISFKQRSSLTTTQIENSDRRLKRLTNPTTIRSEISNNNHLREMYKKEKATENAKEIADMQKKAAKKAAEEAKKAAEKLKKASQKK